MSILHRKRIIKQVVNISVRKLVTFSSDIGNYSVKFQKLSNFSNYRLSNCTTYIKACRVDTLLQHTENEK